MLTMYCWKKLLGGNLLREVDVGLGTSFMPVGDRREGAIHLNGPIKTICEQFSARGATCSNTRYLVSIQMR